MPPIINDTLVTMVCIASDESPYQTESPVSIAHHKPHVEAIDTMFCMFFLGGGFAKS